MIQDNQIPRVNRAIDTPYLSSGYVRSCAASRAIRRNITHPAIKGRHSRIKTGPFIFNTVANHAPPSVAMSWTALKGMLKRMVLNSSKPKASMIKGPNVDMPPLRSDIADIRANQNHFFGSRHVSLTWSHFHWSFSTPCWFIWSLSS